MDRAQQTRIAWMIVVGGMLVAYRRVLPELVQAWWGDGNYSHGFLILPIALYFLWERRGRLASVPPSSSSIGLLVLAGSLLVLAVGVLGAELFLMRVSLIGVLGGAVLWLHGWRTLRVAAFPLAFLMLMIPLPALVFNQIAFPLQLLASRVGESTLSSAGIPVLREGNVLILTNTSLEVAEACSGIRSLVSLITLGLVFGYLTDKRPWVRAVMALSAVPVAIGANGGRVAGTGIAAHVFGPEAALGFFHEFSGWIVFVVSFALMLGIQRVVVRLAPPAPERRAAVPEAA